MTTNTKKMSPKTKTTKTTTKKKTETNAKVTVSPVTEKLSQLEMAYMAAISGKIKFGEVKSIFKQLHKEIKKSVKTKN